MEPLAHPQDLTAALPSVDDAMDEVLVGLPAPPMGRRRLLAALLSGISVMALFLAVQLWDDTRYAMAPSTPEALGDGRVAQPTAADSNRYVTVEAVPSLANAVVYTRPIAPGERLVFAVAGRDGAPLYVQVDRDDARAPGGTYAGRLIAFGGAGGRYARVESYLRHVMGARIDAHTWLLIDGVSPRSLLWAPFVSTLLVALALSDIALLVRLFRRSEP